MTLSISEKIINMADIRTPTLSNVIASERNVLYDQTFSLGQQKWECQYKSDLYWFRSLSLSLSLPIFVSLWNIALAHCHFRVFGMYSIRSFSSITKETPQIVRFLKKWMNVFLRCFLDTSCHNNSTEFCCFDSKLLYFISTFFCYLC